MVNFSLERRNGEVDIVAFDENKNKSLLIVSTEHQLLGSYEAPQNGWTPEVLEALSKTFPAEWGFCGADALLGEHRVGSTTM